MQPIGSGAFLFDCLNVRGDLDFVSNKDAPRFERGVIFETPLSPVDLARRREPRSLLPPGILADALEHGFQRDRDSLSHNREIADQVEPIACLGMRASNAGAAERNRRLLLDVEKVCGPQMRIAIA